MFLKLVKYLVPVLVPVHVYSTFSRGFGTCPTTTCTSTCLTCTKICLRYDTSSLNGVNMGIIINRIIKWHFNSKKGKVNLLSII